MTLEELYLVGIKKKHEGVHSTPRYQPTRAASMIGGRVRIPFLRCILMLEAESIERDKS